MEKIRDATHKGTWYNSDPKALEIELSNYLKCANVVPKSKAKAILVPHAGYRYSGQTAAFGYKLIKPSEFDTIVLLGPSHKVWLDSCALSKCAQYATPFGNIDIDTVAVEKLYESKEFVYMDLNVDENEHSLEMHLPFIFHTMSKNPNGFKLIPIMVGQLNGQKEAKIASLLTPLFLNPRVLFIISSDFCHWGTRFRYTPYSPSLSIQGYITSLDKRGMELISQLSHMNFSNYLKETGNTICGRNPILLLLKIVEELGKTHYKIDFVEYQQSNQIISSSDSCVCYASGYLFHN